MSCSDCWHCWVISCQNGRDTEDTYSFAKCCRVSCIQLCKWIPVFLIWSIIAWSYYVYVYLLCIETLTVLQEKVAYLVIFHLILLLLMWSYVRTIFTSVTKIPDEFYLSDDQVTQMRNEVRWADRRSMLNNMAAPYNFQTVTKDGDARYCEKCQCLKPDRCHHCSICRTCVLKMDHHCPWTDNCIGFYNYKFFILMVFYGVLYTFFVCGTNARFTVEILTTQKVLNYTYANIIILEFVSVLFAIVSLCLLIYHLHLVSNNTSTLETFFPPTFVTDHSGTFSSSCTNNFVQVFGDNCLLWFLPVYSTPGDGVNFTVQEKKVTVKDSEKTSLTIE